MPIPDFETDFTTLMLGQQGIQRPGAVAFAERHYAVGGLYGTDGAARGGIGIGPATYGKCFTGGHTGDQQE